MAEIPFYSAYVERRAQNEAKPARDLQQAAQILTLKGVLEKQQQERAFKQDLSALGPQPTQEAIMGVAQKYADPDRLLSLYGQERARADATRERALQFAQGVEFRQQQLDLQREQFNQRTADAASRMQFEQWYKTETLKNQQAADTLNAQLRMMGFEIQRQGQQLQLAQFDANRRERTNRAVTAFSNELQQNKIPALGSSITTANDLLKRYADKDIPGFGLAQGSSMIPNALRSPEAKEVRSAVQAVSNDLLNLYSGLAVTLPEAERRELEEMRGGNFTSADFKKSWPRIIGRYNTVLGNLKAGANADVLTEYQSRPGAMRLDPVSPAFEGVQAPAAPTASLEFEGYRFPSLEALNAYKKAIGESGISAP